MNQIKPPKITVFAVLTLLATALLVALALNYPLLGSLGSESGILFGLVIGPLMYFGGAIFGAYRDPRGFSQDLLHELAISLLAMVIFASALLLNSFYVSSCAPARGILPFVVHAVPVVVFNSICGLLVGRTIGRRFFAFVAAFLLLAAYVGARAVLWWQNPGFRLLSHPLLVIDGDLLGGAGLSPEIIGFRAATLCFSFALASLGLAFFSSAQSMSFQKEKALRFGTVVPVLVFFFLGGITHYIVVNATLPSPAVREEQLSRALRRGQFVIHSDPHVTTLKEASALLAEANLWGSRLKARMGEVSAADIHIWFYPDSKSLARFTGASHVHFALPNHREIHITNPAVPHPTLGHEIAHVLIGEKTSTVLGLPGVFGIVVNQGLSEGLAVMLTPELSILNDLTLREQAAALAQAGMLPDVKALFSVSPVAFFTHNTAMSYSVAGAYLEDLLERKAGDDKARKILIERLAFSGQIEDVFSSSAEQAQFDSEFMNRLKAFPIPKDAIASVNEIFSARPILSATCADDQSKPLLANDPGELAAQKEKEANDITDAHSLRKQRLLDEAGDLFWQAKLPQKAARLWTQIQIENLPVSEQRTRQAKAIFASTPNSTLSRRGLDYLVWMNADKMTNRTLVSMNLAAELEKRNAEASPPASASMDLVTYLALRIRLAADGNALDIASLERLSVAQTLPFNFQVESLRLIAEARALGSQYALAPDQFRQIAALTPRASTHLQMLDWAERSEHIAAAMPLKPDNEARSDIWLLGTQRFEE